MALWVLWTVVLYGALRLLSVLFARIFGLTLQTDIRRLVLMTENSQGSIEGVVRSFLFRQQIYGRRAEVVCVDTGSSDDTYQILTRLKHRYPALEVRFFSRETITHPSLWEREAAVVDLRKGTAPIGGK
ncbi:hypothetical protein [Salinithrix halophila]|uniref:Glycosyl transferase family 2 n=1 Tax=Salinithrix halophila TaxID=1485204 RepID=A0ABV8JGB6_9BACL